jgi:hypothetical protein
MVHVGLTALQDAEGRWIWVLVQYDPGAPAILATEHSEETYDSHAAALTAGRPEFEKRRGT